MTDLLTPATEPETEEPTDWAGAPDEPEADEVIVRRNGRVAVVLAGVSALVSAAYFARAVTTASTLDWVLCIALAALTWAHVFSFLDSKMPLLVADSHGVRIRLGRTWRGMAWSDLEVVEHLPRRGLRDGRLVLLPHDPDAELELLGRAGRWHARLTQRMNGEPFSLPLALTTRVLGADGDLTGALSRLAGERCEVVELARAVRRPEAEESEVEESEAEETVDESFDDTAETAPVEPAPVVVASPTPSPLRELRPAVRSEVERDRSWDPEATQPVGLPVIAHPTTTFVIDDLASLDVVDPVIGPELKAARLRLRLSIDQVAERTRIRPHVIEAIEIDDFAPCGGDFYARGHLRTLARVLAVDVTPLLATYDERYSDAPIDPRRIFEAELATGRHGPIRGVQGGRNWSVIAAAVMAVVLAWSIARLVMDDRSPVQPTSPSLANGSAGLTSAGQSPASAPVPVVLTAAGGGAHVVVRDGTGKVVFTGSLAFGQSRTVQVAPPIRVQSTDGSLEVTVDGDQRGPIGATGRPAQDIFTG